MVTSFINYRSKSYARTTPPSFLSALSQKALVAYVMLHAWKLYFYIYLDSPPEKQLFYFIPPSC